MLDLANHLVYSETVKINIHEAKTNLSRLLVRVELGEEIILARAGKPVARLAPMEPKSQGDGGWVPPPANSRSPTTSTRRCRRKSRRPSGDKAVKVLLDTHAFLWAITDDRRLTPHARKILRTADLFLSVASLWEIVTKVQIGKLALPEAPSRYLPRHMAALGAQRSP